VCGLPVSWGTDYQGWPLPLPLPLPLPQSEGIIEDIIIIIVVVVIIIIIIIIIISQLGRSVRFGTKWNFNI